MSPVLTRLVARASGRETAGLRPRLPGRFEGGAPEAGGFAEVTETVTADPPARPAPLAEQRQTPHEFPAQTPRPEAQPARVGEESHAAPAPLLPPAPPEPEAARSATPEPEAPEAEASASAPLLPEQPSAAPAPMRPRAQRTATEPRAEPLRRPESAEPPAPLLPEAPLPPGEVREIQEIPRRAQKAPAQPAAVAHQPAAEPPEIVISIGRIEVKTAAAPEKREAPRRETTLTSLGDYLNGGGRGR